MTNISHPKKPLGIKNYGHIPHLPGSRLGPGDHTCHEGQARIATTKVRDRHDIVIVQEKLDGSNVGVALIDGIIYPLTRAGYIAKTSRFEQHSHFADWVYSNENRFRSVLQNNERICGEWLMQAHGTRYKLAHEPFVAFDLMLKTKRLPYDEFSERIKSGEFVTPKVLHQGQALPIDDAMKSLSKYGFHGALDPVEGAIWRVERNKLVNPGKSGERKWVVDFIVKFVRPDKVDGYYLPEISGNAPIWNSKPKPTT